jgi:hypothetical protein
MQTSGQSLLTITDIDPFQPTNNLRSLLTITDIDPFQPTNNLRSSASKDFAIATSKYMVFHILPSSRNLPERHHVNLHKQPDHCLFRDNGVHWLRHFKHANKYSHHPSSWRYLSVLSQACWLTFGMHIMMGKQHGRFYLFWEQVGCRYLGENLLNVCCSLTKKILPVCYPRTQMGGQN